MNTECRNSCKVSGMKCALQNGWLFPEAVLFEFDAESSLEECQRVNNTQVQLNSVALLITLDPVTVTLTVC